MRTLKWDEVISRGGHCTGLQMGEIEELQVPDKVISVSVFLKKFYISLPSSLHSRVASPNSKNPVGQEKETLVPMFVSLVFALNESLVWMFGHESVVTMIARLL